MRSIKDAALAFDRACTTAEVPYALVGGFAVMDVKPARTPAEMAEIEAAIVVPFETGQVKVARAEDTVAYKLKFGSEQDIKDARSILARQGDRIDRHRLRSLVQQLGVGDALQALERETKEDV